MIKSVIDEVARAEQEKTEVRLIVKLTKLRLTEEMI
jgi:hypothetical protein